MSHFAEIDENNIVLRVLVIEQDVIDSGLVGNPSKWIQTSYNTHRGVHLDPKTNQPDGGVALRKNYAGKGFTYDATKDAFIPPKPFASWVFNEDACDWDAPRPFPDDGKIYKWNEETTSWEEIT